MLAPSLWDPGSLLTSVVQNPGQSLADTNQREKCILWMCPFSPSVGQAHLQAWPPSGHVQASQARAIFCFCKILSSPRPHRGHVHTPTFKMKEMSKAKILNSHMRGATQWMQRSCPSVLRHCLLGLNGCVMC
jgi:hypothetical protein